MLKYSMVDVVTVSSSVPRSNFSEIELEDLANHILETGGILKPLILKKVGFEKYEVIEGHFEYYASLKACEKDPVKGEMVNSFIITPEQEPLAKEQIKELKSSVPPISPEGTLTQPSNPLESILEKFVNELQKNNKEYIKALNDLQQHNKEVFKAFIESQEHFKKAQETIKSLEDKIRELENQKYKKSETIEIVENEQALNALNTYDLSQFRKTGVNKNTAQNIITERNITKFTSCNDATRVKGLKGATMSKFINYIQQNQK